MVGSRLFTHSLYTIKLAKMEQVNIRLAQREEMKDVRVMIQELADFEKMSDGPEISAETLMRDGYGDKPLFRCFIAELLDKSADNNARIVCYALTFDSYSTWQGRALFLEDLYVKPEHRGKGIAKKMFVHLAKLAFSEGSSRLDLHVLNWNPARKFYEKLGYNNLTEKEGWMFYRLDRSAIEKLTK